MIAYKERRKKTKKKVEFAKIILGVYAFACLAFIQQDYILAFLNGTAVNSATTTVLIGSLAASIVSYYAKSFLEKNSRNKNKVDEDGTPYYNGMNNNGYNNQQNNPYNH